MSEALRNLLGWFAPRGLTALDPPTLRVALDALEQPALLLDASGSILHANPACALLDPDPASLAGRSAADLLVVGEDYGAEQVHLRRALCGGEDPPEPLLVRLCRDGRRRALQARITRLPLTPQEQVTLLVLSDLSARAEGDPLGPACSQALEMIVEDAPLADTLATLVAAGGDADRVARAVLLLHDRSLICAASHGLDSRGMALLEASGAHFETFEASLIDPEAMPSHPLAAAIRAAGAGGAWCAPIFGCGRELLGGLIELRGAAAGPDEAQRRRLHDAAHIAGIALERDRLAERLLHQAQFDRLTGLPNRTLLEDRFAAVLAETHRAGELAALLFLDIAGFKVVNDTLGHGRGDLLLQEVAQRLRGVTRESDTLGRLGGDEFCLIAPRLGDRSDASRIAHRLVEALSAPFHLDGREIFVSVCIGIAVFPGDGATAVEMFAAADAAMYRAKGKGRNCSEYFSAEMNAWAHEILALETDLRHAIDAGSLALHYQPQADANGRVVGVEALVRWPHERQGLISPARFIPVAEKTGLIVPLGEWVLRHACREAVTWERRLGRAIRVAVNVSAKQFAQADFVDRLRAVLDETGLRPDLLELEVTESLLMGSSDGAEQRLNDIRRMGVHLAIDDFGTGYSSLAYLGRLPIDTLKIDRSFISSIRPSAERQGEANEAVVVATILSLAFSLRLHVVAEGVETELQRRYLARHGCHAMQGYLLSPPVPAEQLGEAIARIEAAYANEDHAIGRTCRVA